MIAASQSMRRRTGARTWVARSCIALSAAALVLAGLGSAGAQEADAPRPDVFRAAASSEVLSATLDRDALVPIADAFRFIALDGEGSFESSNQTARASIFYPGAGGIGGPALVCEQLGADLPPEFQLILDACAGYDFPLSVAADSLNPDRTTVGAAEFGSVGDLISAKGLRAVAHAAPDSSTTDAAIADLRVLGLPGIGSIDTLLPIPGLPELDTSVLSVASATSTTDQRIDGSGALVVDAVSELSGVRLVGGLVTIESVRSATRVTDDGRGDVSQEATLEVGDVSVAGIPAQITDAGLVVGSPTGADGPLVQQLTKIVNDLLRGFGVNVSTLTVEKGVDEAGLSFARVGGVLVEFSTDVRGLPTLPGPLGDIDPNGLYRGAIQLGASGSTGIASFIDVPDFVPSAPESTAPAPPVGETGGSTSAGAPTISPVTPPPPSAPAVEAPGEVAAPTPLPAGFLGDLYAGRVALVYLAFTLIALALCLGPKLTLPARLPGSSP